MTDTAKQPLGILIGRQLSSVTFVQDYVQLAFDGPGLTAITLPTVKVEDTWFKWGDPGYRDMLCERIGKVVRIASVIENEGIRIEFDDGSGIFISLRPEDYYTAEAAIFTNDSQWWVW